MITMVIRAEDRASCEWDGHAYEAQTKKGALCKLARVLKDAGCPDQPVSVVGEDGKPRMRGPSLHKLARVTVSEGEHTPRFVWWAPDPRFEREAA